MYLRRLKSEDFNNVIAENECALSNSKKVIVRKVLFNGQECIDMRIWVIWGQDQQWHPTKQGLFLNMDDFNQKILPLLNIVAKPK